MRLVIPLLTGLIGTAILVWLGLWQLDRLAWKEGVLAAIDARIGQAPGGLPAAPAPLGDAFLPVTVTGRFTGQDIDVLVGLKDLGAGVRIVAAFETAEGRRILIDRGFRPEAQRRAPRVAAEATVTGNLHWPDDLNSSTPPPDARTGLWFARDLPAMAEALGTEPVLVVARSQTGDGIRPLPLDSAGIPNHHLGYAIQWFALAFVWAAMTAFWLWRNRRRPG